MPRASRNAGGKDCFVGLIYSDGYVIFESYWNSSVKAHICI